ncbi:MAG TPA: enoyl-CoA hydratase family protein [Acidimicrobiia bacterium]|nr:enoyl-CoA hydratase family protein [Acidimicrobiia bacterium]
MPVRTERTRDHIAEVVLDVPPVNALTSRDFRDLARQITDLGEDPSVRAVILRSGNDRGFAAGVDVGELTAGGPRAVVEVTRACADAYGAVYDCAAPVVAAVHGFCLATGVGLAGNADIVIAADDATFGLPEVDAGGLGTATQLARLVPEKKARWLAYSGTRVDADAVHRWGGVDRVVPRGQLLEEARRVAATLAAKSPVVLRRARASLQAIDPADARRSFRREMGLVFELNLTPAPDEARAALSGRPRR